MLTIKISRAILLLALSGSAFSTEAENSKTLASPNEARAKSYFGDELLVDQDGAEKRFYSDLLSKKVVLINVIFANCKDACPMQTQKLKASQKRLGNRFGSDIVFLSLSIDPKRDTPASMKKFAQQQGADHDGWRFLVANPEVMQKVLTRLGQWSGEPASHSTLLIAGNARKAHWLKLRPDAPPERIADDLLRLADE
jgi:protein SCO1